MDVLVRRKAAGVMALLCTLFFLSLSLAHAEEKPLELYEQKVKAGLIYNLLKYTVWPENSTRQGKLQICLFGEDPFDGYLFPLEGRTAQQAPITVKQIKQVDQAENCSVIFIPRNQENRLSELTAFLKDKHVLTISDIRQFARRGGMVEMIKEGEKINLYINKNTVEHAGLEIGDRMLRLAKLVPG